MRRTLYPALAVFALPFLTGVVPAQTAMFRGGPEHTGVYQSTVPALSTVAWKFRTDGRVISTPVVVGEVVYVGSTDGGLYAVNRRDGTQRWKFATQGPVT